MSDPSSDASAIPAASSGDLDLVAADLNDFINGSELYVRGRVAVCVRFDYPHVYWRWTDDAAVQAATAAGLPEPMEKHRSFSCTPEIFQVQSSKKRRPGDDPHGLAGTQQMAQEDTSDEDDESEEREAAERERRRQQQEQAGAGGAETPVPEAADVIPAAAAAAPQGGEARASLMSMFSRRPEKAVFTNVADAGEEVIHAAAPQSVSIENSQRAKFRVEKKVTSLTLLQCEDVEVEFLAVISSVELIRCKRCILRCTQTAQTFQLDESTDSQISFPGFQERVMLVSTGSSGTTVTAVPGGNPPPADGDEKQPAGIDAEVRYEVDSFREEEAAAAADAEATPEADSDAAAAAGASAASSSSAPPKQYRTVWSRGSFQTELLERRTAQGYFANNA
jgi:hypothetical protein